MRGMARWTSHTSSASSGHRIIRAPSGNFNFCRSVIGENSIRSWGVIALIDRLLFVWFRIAVQTVSIVP
jgi:hypothetical protein